MSLSDVQVDLSKLNEADKQDLSVFVARESQKANLQESISGFTDRCFKKCITGTPRTGTLDSSEESCMKNCVGRFIEAHTVLFEHVQKTSGQGH